jgi:hypothetical protein
VTVHSTPYNLAAGAANYVTAGCGAGQSAVGGGFDVATGDAQNEDSYPSTTTGTPPDPGDTAWTVFVFEASGTNPATGHVYVTCVG